MRKGKVFVDDCLAGIISEEAGEFAFEYDNENPIALCLSFYY